MASNDVRPDLPPEHTKGMVTYVKIYVCRFLQKPAHNINALIMVCFWLVHHP